MNAHVCRTGFWGLAVGVFFACGNGPAKSFNGRVYGVERVTGTPLDDANGAVKFLSEPSGFFPATLASPVRVTVPARGEVAANLLISASASTAWVSVRAHQPAKVTSGGVSLLLDGAQSALVPVAVKWGVVKFASETEVQLTVQVVGYFDQSGAGWVVDASSESKTVQLGGAGVEVELAGAQGNNPDDTWGRWVLVSGDDNVTVTLGVCGSGEVESLTLAEASGVPVLLPRGKVCLAAAGSGGTHANVKLKGLGRFRRFVKTSWRSTESFTVLDTQRGIGWSGLPAEGQPLELSLQKVTGLSGAEQVMLRASAEAGTGTVTIGRCDGSGDRMRIDGSTRTVPVSGEGSLCVEAKPQRHVRIDVVGAVFPGDAETTQCAPFPEPARCEAVDLVGRLSCIPGVTAVRGTTAAETYSLTIEQPVDHARPDGPTFRQRVQLRYAGPNAPVSLHTTGYELFENDSDVAATFQTTELEVEHRFFGTSRPASNDFATMDIVQSAQDSHRIVELLRPVLGNAWVSTGHSKGGMTALFHRRFFPCDVDGTVPFVAPITYGLGDKRLGAFLQQIGGEKYAACRQVFVDADRAIITDKARYSTEMPGTYNKMGGVENALWASVGMTSWALFQYGEPDHPTHGCPAYETYRASTDWPLLVDNFAHAAESYSDQKLGIFEVSTASLMLSYLYQTVNELGTQGATLEHLADLGPIPESLPRYEPLSLGVLAVPSFEPRAMHDVQEWLKAHGKGFLFVYGEFDPWTGGAVELGNAEDSAVIMVAGANHGARFSLMSAEDRRKGTDMVLRWLGPRQRLSGGNVVRHLTPKRFHDIMRARGI